jgi:hypothetical protein
MRPQGPRRCQHREQLTTHVRAGSMKVVADRSGAYRCRMGQLQGSDRVLGVGSARISGTFTAEPRMRVTAHDKTQRNPPLSFDFSTTIATT